MDTLDLAWTFYQLLHLMLYKLFSFLTSIYLIFVLLIFNVYNLCKLSRSITDIFVSKILRIVKFLRFDVCIRCILVPPIYNDRIKRSEVVSKELIIVYCMYKSDSFVKLFVSNAESLELSASKIYKFPNDVVLI